MDTRGLYFAVPVRERCAESALFPLEVVAVLAVGAVGAEVSAIEYAELSGVVWDESRAEEGALRGELAVGSIERGFEWAEKGV
jgi:hypothetical protein